MLTTLLAMSSSALPRLFRAPSLLRAPAARLCSSLSQQEINDQFGQDLSEQFELYAPPAALAPLAPGEAPRALNVRKARSEVHRDGDWHRSIHVWFASTTTGELLLQQRSALKDTHPNLWDVSCAGHLTAGDASVDTAVREVEEELGLTVSDAAIAAAFVCCMPNEATGSTPKHGAFFCNEFQDIYLLALESVLPAAARPTGGGSWALDELRLGHGEVAGVELRAAEEVLATWEAGPPHDLVPRPHAYAGVLREALRGLR